DGAHVDAELEARGGDDPADAAALQVLLDLAALAVGEAAVMGAHELLARQLVEALAQALAQAAAVHEHDRRAMGADVLEQAWMDRRPQPLGGIGRRIARRELGEERAAAQVRPA